MEGVLRNITNVIVYIDDLLVHTKAHKDQLKLLDPVLNCFQHHNLKINLDKCFFSNKDVSYLGFTLTPECIKLGKKQIESNQRCKTTHLHQNNQIFHWALQFFPDAHKFFGYHRGTLVQAYQKGFRLQRLFQNQQWMLFAF
jgi:hypothetical protein